MHAYSVNPPTLHPLKREVQLVDHLNNAVNNSTVIAAKKKRDTIGLEPDQQSARRNSKFSICAAEKRSLHLHDKQDVCAGAEAAGGGARARRAAVKVPSAEHATTPSAARSTMMTHMHLCKMI